MKLSSLFYLDQLSLLMIALGTMVIFTIGCFSTRYMKGDKKERSLLTYFFFLFLCHVITLAADHIGLFFMGWCLSNFFLFKLLILKDRWKAARAAGWLAAKMLLISSLCVGRAFLILYLLTQQTSIRTLSVSPFIDNFFFRISLETLLIGAMAQSALWPFHRWMLSSLNAPTPVSALLQTGFINPGILILTRLAPLWTSQIRLMHITFLVGLISAVLGSLWKLVQPDHKHMLTCSTIGQMGFIVMQCGMGLFSFAIAHLCWHGLFKAYLFLSAGSAAQEKQPFIRPRPPALPTFFLALICGTLAQYIFRLTSGLDSFAYNTHFMTMGIPFIAATQLALTLLTPWQKNFMIALFATSMGSCLYGLNIRAIIFFLPALDHPQPLSLLHIGGMGILMLGWLLFTFGKQNSRLVQALYIKILNTSQPHPSTITAHHNSYEV